MHKDNIKAITYPAIWLSNKIFANAIFKANYLNI